MSWKPMSRAKALAGNTKTVTAVSLSGIARKVSKVCLVLRPHLLEDAAWVATGTRITVLQGDGEHAGMLRVQPDKGGDFVLAKAGGKRNTGTLMVFLPWVDGAQPVQHAPTAVGYTAGAGFLELRLPAWARPPAPGLAKAAEAAAVARDRAGYTGISARVPDQAAADRVAARRAGAL